MIIRFLTSLGNCSIGRLNLAGLGGQKLNVQRLNPTLSSENSDRWKRVAIGLVCQSIASLLSATSLTSLLIGICTKLVLWCFKSFQCSHDLPHVLLSDVSVDSLMVKGPSELHLVFTVSLNGVAIGQEEVEGQWHVCRIFCVILYSHGETFSLRLGSAC